jgi:O-acetylhomoserine/O-acetylserine sulfhydrylase-like pyridoxal-dependent enzyme
MEHNNDWRYDLKLGQKGENLLAHILLLKGDTIEVKTDFQAQETGNVFVEYKSRDALSGISTSTATFWAFVISNEQIVIIESKKLKKICKIKGLKRVKGGDENTSEGILVPVCQLLSK